MELMILQGFLVSHNILYSIIYSIGGLQLLLGLLHPGRNALNLVIR